MISVNCHDFLCFLSKILLHKKRNMGRHTEAPMNAHNYFTTLKETDKRSDTVKMYNLFLPQLGIDCQTPRSNSPDFCGSLYRVYSVH